MEYTGLKVRSCKSMKLTKDAIAEEKEKGKKAVQRRRVVMKEILSIQPQLENTWGQ